MTEVRRSRRDKIVMILTAPGHHHDVTGVIAGADSADQVDGWVGAGDLVLPAATAAHLASLATDAGFALGGQAGYSSVAANTARAARSAVGPVHSHLYLDPVDELVDVEFLGWTIGDARSQLLREALGEVLGFAQRDALRERVQRQARGPRRLLVGDLRLPLDRRDEALAVARRAGGKAIPMSLDEFIARIAKLEGVPRVKASEYRILIKQG